MAALGLFVLTGCNAINSLDTSFYDLEKRSPEIGSEEAKRVTANKTSHADAFAPKEGPKDTYVSQSEEYGAAHRNLVLSLREDFKPDERYYRSVERIQRTLSAQCRRILAETGIETTSLRSPTLSADINNDGDFGSGISYDFVDLTRANLKEELALARCARRAALLRMSQLLLTTNQSLTRSGFVAQAESLAASRGEFDAIKRRLNRELNNGTITAQQADTLRQRMRLVQAIEAKSRAQAQRRDVAYRIMQHSFRKLDQDITAAERRIADISSRLRTADAFRVRGRASYGRQADAEAASIGGGTGDPNEFSANVQVSVRLGALTRRRYELERTAADARVDEYYEADSGAVWRAREQAKINRKAIASLTVQRAELRSALRSAKQKTRAVLSSYEDEAAMSQMYATIDVLSIKAQIAGVNRTISDTKRMEDKLRFRK